MTVAPQRVAHRDQRGQHGEDDDEGAARHVGRDRDAVDERREEHDREDEPARELEGTTGDDGAAAQQQGGRGERRQRDSDLGQRAGAGCHVAEGERHQPEHADEEQQHPQVGQAVGREVGPHGAPGACPPAGDRARLDRDRPRGGGAGGHGHRGHGSLAGDGGKRAERRRTRCDGGDPGGRPAHGHVARRRAQGRAQLPGVGGEAAGLRAADESPRAGVREEHLAHEPQVVRVLRGDGRGRERAWVRHDVGTVRDPGGPVGAGPVALALVPRRVVVPAGGVSDETGCRSWRQCDPPAGAYPAGAWRGPFPLRRGGTCRRARAATRPPRRPAGRGAPPRHR
jgi:hypothetical protein